MVDMWDEGGVIGRKMGMLYGGQVNMMVGPTS